jgi:hypothetical protein
MRRGLARKQAVRWERLSRPEKEQAVTLLEERAIQGPRGKQQGHSGKRKR